MWTVSFIVKIITFTGSTSDIELHSRFSIEILGSSPISLSNDCFNPGLPVTYRAPRYLLRTKYTHPNEYFLTVLTPPYGSRRRVRIVTSQWGGGLLPSLIPHPLDPNVTQGIGLLFYSSLFLPKDSL